LGRRNCDLGGQSGAGAYTNADQRAGHRNTSGDTNGNGGNASGDNASGDHFRHAGSHRNLTTLPHSRRQSERQPQRQR
jgi:hypothetical protein